jgi:PAS domain S-box-containing protein
MPASLTDVPVVTALRCLAAATQADAVALLDGAGRTLAQHGASVDGLRMLLPAGASATVVLVRAAGEWSDAQRAVAEPFADLVQSLLRTPSGDGHELIANVPGVVWEELLDGSSRFVSGQIEPLLGYTAEEYRSFASFLDLVHEDDRARVAAATARMLDSGNGGAHAFRMRRKDGTVIWCESHCSVIAGEDGRAIGMRGVSIDVSARHEAEERLRASEEHFRQLANATPVMIWTTDAAGRAQFQNRQLVALIGNDNALGDRWAEHIHPEDCERILRALTEAHERQEPVTLELRYRRHDGDYRDLFVQAAPRTSADGTFIGMVGSCTDLTESRRLERRMQAERQLTSLGRLAATIAHEMNNVLMAVQPFADVIRKAPSHEVLQRVADHISNSVQRGRRITHEILRYASTSDPVCEPVDVRAWLCGIRDELKAVLGPGVELTIDAPHGLCMLADEHQMTQVLTNLAANARDAMARKGALAIAARAEDECIHFVVRDSGPGIPPDALRHLFEPLFTTKTGGTGLGLAIVHDIVRRHHGEVAAESAEGSGAVFHLRIPATDRTPVAVPHDAESLPQSVRRVLLIEDDETVALAISGILEMEGAEVAVVSQGGAALEAIARVEPDVVVLDVGLPDVPGTAVFERIRASHPALPVIFSTGHADDLGEHLDDPDGRTAHLMKPYEVSTLIRTICALVP